MKVEYTADHHEAKKPVVMVQVTNNPVERAADEDNEFPQGTHLKTSPPQRPSLPRANAPVGEARPIVANATMEMILFRGILLSSDELSQVLRRFRRQDYFNCRIVLALICSFGRRAFDNSEFRRRRRQ